MRRATQTMTTESIEHNDFFNTPQGPILSKPPQDNSASSHESDDHGHNPDPDQEQMCARQPQRRSLSCDRPMKRRC